MKKYLVKIAIPSRKNRWEASVDERTIKAENFNGMLMKAITPDELQAGARIFEIKELPVMVKSFYFPLAVYNRDSCYYYEDDDGEGEYAELDERLALLYRPCIEQDFREYQGGDDMTQYFTEYDNETACKKIKHIEWGFEEANNRLYGKVDVALTEELTAEETESLKQWIAGQNSDGLGEGFEQHTIHTRDHMMHDRIISVSFWHHGDNYHIYDEAEFDNIRFGLN